MSIKSFNYDFFEYSDGQMRPILPINIINPHSGKEFKWHALVDTGADSSLFNRDICDILEHNIRHEDVSTTTNKGISNNILVTTFCHTFIIELYHPNNNEVIWRSKEVLIDCLDEEDSLVLLGANDFLSNFKITFDYRKQKTTVHLQD
jgi:hypothetical protein